MAQRQQVTVEIKRLSLRIPSELHRLLRIEAAKRETTIEALATEAFRAAIGKRQKEVAA